jgi:hypothetical protein
LILFSPGRPIIDKSANIRTMGSICRGQNVKKTYLRFGVVLLLMSLAACAEVQQPSIAGIIKGLFDGRSVSSVSVRQQGVESLYESGKFNIAKFPILELISGHSYMYVDLSKIRVFLYDKNHQQLILYQVLP